jgi:hypothetical protein
VNPKLRHLEAVVAKTRGTTKLIRVIGGIEGAPIMRVDCGTYTLIGPMADLQIEDPSGTLQSKRKRKNKPHRSRSADRP